MSWIQENKFVAGLIGVTAVVGGAILYFGGSQGSSLSEKMESYEGLKAKYANLEKSNPYPNRENLKGREKNIKEYQQSIKDVTQALEAYRPDELAKMTPEEFGDARVAMRNTLREAFKGAGTKLPVETDFGFEKYSKSSAKSVATPQLNYQLGATEWLLTKLAEVKPSALVNMSRVSLPIEGGQAVPAPEPTKKSKKKKGCLLYTSPSPRD